MTFVEAALLLLACTVARGDVSACFTTNSPGASPMPSTPPITAVRTGNAVDVILTAQAALVWDVNTNAILYEKNADTRRPVASLSKLISVITIQELFQPADIVPIPTQARRAQQLGANIRLPIGQHASVSDLLAASLIASANDAVVTLAVAAAGSEEAFVERANAYAASHGFANTRLANATGLSGGDQYSTARDMMLALQRVYSDPALRTHLAAEGGVLRTQEGTARAYTTTNKLLGTYVPILAAKTGYTTEAGQNLAIITHDEAGHTIGAVVLGSDQRFQDMKVLVEWIWRNYTWQ